MLLSNFDGQVFLGPRTATRDKNLNTPVPLPPNLPGIDAKIVLTESFRTDSPIELVKGGYIKNYKEMLVGNLSVVEETITGEPAIVSFGNFIYLMGWLDDIALERIIISSLDKANINYVKLPHGVRVRETENERFWFNYSRTEKELPLKNLKPGGVFLEKLDLD